MRTVTPALEAILRDRFQSAGSGYRGRLEVDFPGECGTFEPFTVTDSIVGPVTFYRFRLCAGSASGPDGSAHVLLSGETLPALPAGATPILTWHYGVGIAVTGHITTQPLNNGTPSATSGGGYIPDAGLPLVQRSAGAAGDDLGWEGICGFGACSIDVPAGGFDLGGIECWWGPALSGSALPWESDPVSAALMPELRPKRIAINRNLRMGPDQADVDLPNEDLALGYGPTSIFSTNIRCRIYEWFGDTDNEVLRFTGIIDKITDTRDPLTTSLTCRSLAGAILVDQTFSTFAPQGADEAGHNRSEGNGVYQNVEVSYVALDRLTRAGWPADSIDVADTSFVLDEFIVEDGASEWDTLTRLAGFVSYELWDDEDGIIHFRTIGALPGADTDLTPDYEYEIGVGL